MEALVRQTGFTCVAYEQLPTDEFLIVAKVESPRDVKVTIDVGQHFPATAPVFMRAVLASRTEHEAEAYVARWGLPAFNRLTISDRHNFFADLETIRKDGVVVSRGEYYLMNTALAAPVSSIGQSAQRGICLVAFSSEIPDTELNGYCKKIRSAAEAISAALGVS
jgi:DNA-binding IclR family transcriptional regulator